MDARFLMLETWGVSNRAIYSFKYFSKRARLLKPTNVIGYFRNNQPMLFRKENIAQLGIEDAFALTEKLPSFFRARVPSDESSLNEF